MYVILFKYHQSTNIIMEIIKSIQEYCIKYINECLRRYWQPVTINFIINIRLTLNCIDNVLRTIIVYYNNIM